MLPDSSVHSLINQQRVRDGLAIPSHPPLPLGSHTISRSLCLPLFSPPVPGVAASPLPTGQLKDRAHPLGPFSGDRGLKEPRRGPPSPAPELSVGGTPSLKPRRHSDTDKPKGKRPCKTKHTSHREREREKRKEATPNSPGQRCVADLGAAEDDKVSADGMSGRDTSDWMLAAAESVSVCLSAPLIMQLGEGGGEGERKEVCLQCLEGCWSFDLLVPSATPRGAPACMCVCLWP